MASDANENRSRKTGQWSTSYDVNALYGVVAAVARFAEPDFPRSVSQRKWDDARGAAGHPMAPSARQITTRLRLGWENVKRIALDSDRSIEQTAAGLSKTSKEERKRTPREIHYGLRRVATALGFPSFSSVRYDRTRSELIEAERRRLGDESILARLMPTSYQILNSLEEGQTWNDALVMGGLEPYEQDRSVKTALSTQEAYDIFIELFDVRPSRNDMCLRVAYDTERDLIEARLLKNRFGPPEADDVLARSEDGWRALTRTWQGVADGPRGRLSPLAERSACR